jgi:cysteinyl-tRNA synthetase
MSKSLGNILTLKEIFKDWHPEVIRLFLLSHHYRSPVDFSFDTLSEARSGLDRFYTTLKAVRDEAKIPPSPSRAEGFDVSPAERRGEDDSILKGAQETIESFKARFEESMDDDFNAAQALGYFHDLQRCLNTLLDLSKGHPNEKVILLLKQGLDHFSKMGWIFGLFQNDPETFLREQKQEGLKRQNLSEKEVFNLIEERNAARKEKNWKRADEIRRDLLSKGIVLEDTPAGTIWKIK